MSKTFSQLRQELNEYSSGQLKSDAEDLARGQANRMTFGTYPTIEGGIKSVIKGTPYKSEIEKAKKADAASEKRSPNLYHGPVVRVMKDMINNRTSH